MPCLPPLRYTVSPYEMITVVLFFFPSSAVITRPSSDPKRPSQRPLVLLFMSHSIIGRDSSFFPQRKARCPFGENYPLLLFLDDYRASFSTAPLLLVFLPFFQVVSATRQSPSLWIFPPFCSPAKIFLPRLIILQDLPLIPVFFLTRLFLGPTSLPPPLPL